MAEKLFDLSEEYDEMLHRGLQLSGERKEFFLSGRIMDLCRQLPAGFTPRRILDFGCGLGDSSGFLATVFESAEIVGVDTAEPPLARAETVHGSERVSFHLLSNSLRPGFELGFDLCYVNGVFHHISPADRIDTLAWIHRSLSAGGFLAFFENNPWNPGTRWVMRRIPFDRDAEPLSSRKARKLLSAAGFEKIGRARYLFYFPRMLALLRPFEPWLARLHGGAQYWILAAKGPGL